MRKKWMIGLWMAVWMLQGAAMAESAGSAGSAQPVVDLTGVIVSLGVLVFDLILGWAAKNVLPVACAWLKERTTESQRKMIYELTGKLVEAAEQLMGVGKGSEKLQYVMDGLKARGIEVDVDLIEAAVREMNGKALEEVGKALGST